MARLPEASPTRTLPALTARLRPSVTHSTRRTPARVTSASRLTIRFRPPAAAGDTVDRDAMESFRASGLLLAGDEPVEALEERHPRGVEEAPLEQRDEGQGAEEPVGDRVEGHDREVETERELDAGDPAHRTPVALLSPLVPRGLDPGLRRAGGLGRRAEEP